MPSAARGLNSPMGLLDLALWVDNRTVMKRRDGLAHSNYITISTIYVN